MRAKRATLYPALLKHWRGQRGLSQLDLALAADVSSRHVSFLETGRSAPSAAMVVRLATALDVPLRHVDAMLEAAGHEPIYARADAPRALPEAVVRALEMMKRHHEPFPLIVVDRVYDIVDLNAGALALLSSVLGEDAASRPSVGNLVLATFDPHGAQPAIANFDAVGRAVLWRLQREVLADPDDGQLRDLLDRALAMPTIREDWRRADLTAPSTPAIGVDLRVGTETLRFLTTVTAFQAPRSVALDELRIETWYPVDATTETYCRTLA